MVVALRYKAETNLLGAPFRTAAQLNAKDVKGHGKNAKPRPERMPSQRGETAKGPEEMAGSKGKRDKTTVPG